MWGALAVASHYKTAIPGSDVVFLDENNEDNFFEKFKEVLKTRDMVGFSLTSMQIKYTLPLIKYIREYYPNIKVIGGGIHMILFPNEDYGDYFDEIVTGEMPKDHFLHELYPEKVLEVFRKKRAQVISGFNCSYKCTFCVNSVRNCKYESMAPEKICAEIDYLVDKYNPPKIYFRDSGILHSFLDAPDPRSLKFHPKVGSSWEGFALEEVIRSYRARDEETFFWATHNQAELDLLISRGNRKVGFEFKYNSSPRLTRSMQIAFKDLKLSELAVIFPGTDEFPLSPHVKAIGLKKFLSKGLRK